MWRRDRFDLVIVGMGSAGTVAAELAATRLGLRVAAVERDRVGGDCLWTGCVPSKAIIASAGAAHRARGAGSLGVEATAPTIDRAEVWRRMHRVQRSIAETDDDPDRFHAMGVELIHGEARVTGPTRVEVGGRTLDTRYVLLCTGSRAAVPAIQGIDQVGTLTSDDLFGLDEPPGSVVVIGGGPVGCEVGQALARLGVEVALVEMDSHLLPADEPRHADRLADVLRADGVDLRVGRRVASVTTAPAGVEVTLDDGAILTAESLFSATGRDANVESLGLSALGIERDAGGVRVDDRNRTSVRTIYAVGDVTGRRRFTHAAAYDAGMAVRDMFLPGRGRPRAVVPWCTFTDPEVAHVGLTLAEAVERFGARRVDVRRHDLRDNDRARTDASTDGEIEIVTHRGRVVGGHAICRGAGELIHELALAVDQQLPMRTLGQMIHVYPTLSTGIGRLAADATLETAGRLRPLAKLGRLRR